MKPRIIARLDIKNDDVIKGIHLEGLRKVGSPITLAKKYYAQNIDEIIFMDAVASLYRRNSIYETIAMACKEIFVPVTIGGGIRTLEDIKRAMSTGADKVAVNTAFIENPTLIKKFSNLYGSQAIVGSIEAKQKGNSWEAYICNGKEPTGIDVIEWAKELEDKGVGELLITSIDQEGTKRGLDFELYNEVSKVVSIPIIASGGIGQPKHILQLSSVLNISAFALASILHYNSYTIDEIKNLLPLGFE